MIRCALELAASGQSSDLPVAAVIFDANGAVIASSKNAVFERGRATAHAELLAIERLDSKFLRLYGGQMSMAVTLEPCPMCAWAIRASGIGKLIFGAYNPQYGAAGSVYDLLRDKGQGRHVEVMGGVLEEECQWLLGGAFQEIRNKMVGGDVSERPKVQLSKSCVGESPPWVQIPPSPLSQTDML